MCITTTPQLWAAQTPAISGSASSPLTSLTMSAPATSAASATAALHVSMEISPSHSARNAAITGTVRAVSSAAATGSAPGRVDSPPMSISSAPSAIIWRAWRSALAMSKCVPPSENESGVTFKIPITRARCVRSSSPRRVFQIIGQLAACSVRRWRLVCAR